MAAEMIGQRLHQEEMEKGAENKAACYCHQQEECRKGCKEVTKT
jgi:hypothetical protein